MFSLINTGVAFLIVVIFYPVPSYGERVWDAELGRYLTPQEMVQEDVLTEELDAARLTFPNSERIGKETILLTPEQKERIEERIGWHFPESEFVVYVGKTGAEIDGYAIVQNTIGKHKAITYMVGVTPKGRVLNIEVLVYREAKGAEVGTKRFNAQYEGKTVFDPIRINKDVINITGATMSVRSMSAGVKRTLVMVDELYLKPIGRGSDTIEVKRKQQGVLGRLFGGLLGN